MSDEEALYEETMQDLANDNYGLWEVVWQANTFWPTMSHARKYRIATAAVKRLLATGLVKLTYNDEVVDPLILPDLQTVAPLDQSDFVDTRWWLVVPDIAAFRAYMASPGH